MALTIDSEGTISIVQGDSGEIVVSGLNTSENVKVYFAIRTLKRSLIGSELMVQSNNASQVVFVLTSSFTDLLTVPADKEYEIYQYGIKLCVGTKEDTVNLTGDELGKINQIIVYPKKVEGV